MVPGGLEDCRPLGSVKCERKSSPCEFDDGIECFRAGMWDTASFLKAGVAKTG